MGAAILNLVATHVIRDFSDLGKARGQSRKSHKMNANSGEVRSKTGKGERSWVWSFSGFPVRSDGQVDYTKTKCKLCKVEKNNSGNTSTMGKHLQRLVEWPQLSQSVSQCHPVSQSVSVSQSVKSSQDKSSQVKSVYVSGSISSVTNVMFIFL